MESRDWLVTDDGRCETCPIPDDWEWTDRPYRLYRFLTDLDDVLEHQPDTKNRLAAIRPLVRRLLTSSYWLQGEYHQPDPEKGWSVLTVYDEMDYPITVQTVVWLPGFSSTIHNHATWGLVAIMSGQEKNTIWRRSPDRDHPDRIEAVDEALLTPGDIITLTPDAIHHVECMGDEPTISFNLYGASNYDQRYEFDPVNHTAKNF